MHDYYEVRRRRKRLPVLPLALLLRCGFGGRRRARYVERALGCSVLTFCYWQAALPDLALADLPEDNPVTHAFAPLLRDRESDPVRLIRNSLVGAIRTERDPSRRMLLAAFLENYVPLSENQRDEVEQEVSGTTSQEVGMLLTSWHKAGLAEGKAEGRVEGKMDGLREAVIRVLENRFGTLPRAMYNLLSAESSSNTLRAWLDLAVSAKELAAIESAMRSLGAPLDAA